MALSPMLGGTRVKLCAAGRFFFFTVMGAIEMALSPMLVGTRVKLCAAGPFFFYRHGSDRNGAEPNVRGDSRQALCCRASLAPPTPFTH